MTAHKKPQIYIDGRRKGVNLSPLMQSIIADNPSTSFTTIAHRAVNKFWLFKHADHDPQPEDFNETMYLLSYIYAVPLAEIIRTAIIWSDGYNSNIPLTG